MLDYLALIILIFAFVTVFYGIIAIHDIPYEISVHRKHPHQDAIHYAGWVSLFTLHAIWPFLWIWATLYREDRGWGMASGNTGESKSSEELTSQLVDIQQRLEKLEQSSEQGIAKHNTETVDENSQREGEAE